MLVAYHGTDSEVVIPNGVTEIGPSVFEAAEEGEEGFDLLKVTIPASVTRISDRAFYGAELTEVVFAEGSALRELGRSAFAYCAKLPAITLPEGLEIIGANAFDGDGKLGEIAIPASVTEIGDYAFNVCSGLKAVRFASGNVSQLKTIGSFAFYQCYRLTSLELPEGVVSIGDSALRIARGLKRVYLPSTLTQLGTTEAPAVFAPVRESVVLTGADDLQSITVADGNPNYCSKDGLLYTADGRTLLYCPAGRTGTVTVADGTQSIGENAFHRSQADHVVLPDGLKTIGARGFIKGGFTSIELPDSVERIGASAFFFCEKLKTVQLGAGLQTIERSAFSESPLTNVTVPAGVQTIGTNAFDNIRGWIRFAGKDTVLEEDCLSGTASLTVYGHAGSTAEAFVAAAQEQLGDRCGLRFVSIDDFVGVTAVQLAQTTLSLKQRESAQLSAAITPENATNTALVYKSLNSRVASVDAGGRVTALQPGTAVIRVLSPDGPYAECTVTVTRDESYSDFTIDERGFITGYAGEDTDLVIPDTVSGKTVVGIADGAFRENWSIESLTLPDTLQEIGADAFSRCGNLARIHFGSGLKTIGARAFEYCTHLQELELPEGLETMGEYVFDSCENLESVVLPTTLRVIPQGAFHICWRLRTLNVPEGVETIGKDAFYECEGMTALTLPTSLRTICTGAFAACVRLTEVTIPEGVETIEQQAFMSCTALTRIHLPATLKTLGGVYAGDAFERSDVLGCDHLTAVTVTAGSPYFSAYDGLLYNADGTELVFCPRGLPTAAVREGTQRIGDYAFFYCRSLKSVTLPSTLKTIGQNAMGICERLTSLRLPEGVEHIDRSAFASDAALVSVRLPSTLKTVGPHAFLGTGLQKLELPAGVQSLGEQALAYNTALTSVTIRSGATDLGAALFLNTPDVTVWTDSTSAPIYAYAKANGIPVRLLSSGGSGGSGGSGSVSAGHDVTVPAAANGSVSVSPKSAAKGDTVTVTVTPDKGYTLGSLTVTDDSGNRLSVTDKGNGKYTFTMPDGDVRISASFRAASGSTGFADVAADAWYAEAVAWAAEKGVTAGTADGVFSPDGVCTRAQVVTFLWRANGCPAPSGSGRSFADVPAGAWYAEAVAWAVEQGITEGVSANRFAPNAAVTRAQTVTFLWRAAGKPTASRGSFADVPAGTWYAGAVAWAAEQGVTSGMTADTFAPDASCTRAQIVTFLYRAAK